MPTEENPRTIRRQYEYSISKSILTEIYITKSFTQKKLYLLIKESPDTRVPQPQWQRDGISIHPLSNLTASCCSG